MLFVNQLQSVSIISSIVCDDFVVSINVSTSSVNLIQAAFALEILLDLKCFVPIMPEAHAAPGVSSFADQQSCLVIYQHR